MRAAHGWAAATTAREKTRRRQLWYSNHPAEPSAEDHALLLTYGGEIKGLGRHVTSELEEVRGCQNSSAKSNQDRFGERGLRPDRRPSNKNSCKSMVRQAMIFCRRLRRRSDTGQAK